MGCTSGTEILIVAVVIMLVMGVNRLPQIGDALGRAIRNFKKGVQGENEIDVTPPKKQIPPTHEDDEVTRPSRGGGHDPGKGPRDQ